MGVLEIVIDKIIKHDKLHPEHGVGCICHDRHAATIRVALRAKGLRDPEHEKSLRNLKKVFRYLLH